jgi:hypothetical protein
MAEETKTTTETTTPEVDYKALFEEMEIKYSNLKTSFDKTSSEVADYKRKERDRMSEDDKKKVEDAEREAYYQKLEREHSEIMYGEELDDITDDKTKKEIVNHFVDGKIKEALAKFKEWRKKDRAELEKTIRAELLKTNPQPSAQGASPTAKTKADIMAIQDYELRQAAIAQNMHLFK